MMTNNDHILILVGKSASGKDTIQKELVEKYGYSPIVSTTTRPIREGEKEGVNYFYTSRDEFQKRIDEGKFLEYRSYNTLVNGKPDTWFYGTEKLDLHDKNVVVLDPIGASIFADYYGADNCYVAYIDVPDDIRKERAMRRGSFDEIEWQRRLETDAIDFDEDLIEDITPNYTHINNVGNIHKSVISVANWADTFTQNRMVRDADSKTRLNRFNLECFNPVILNEMSDRLDPFTKEFRENWGHDCDLSKLNEDALGLLVDDYDLYIGLGLDNNKNLSLYTIPIDLRREHEDPDIRNTYYLQIDPYTKDCTFTRVKFDYDVDSIPQAALNEHKDNVWEDLCESFKPTEWLEINTSANEYLVERVKEDGIYNVVDKDCYIYPEIKEIKRYHLSGQDAEKLIENLVNNTPLPDIISYIDIQAYIDTKGCAYDKFMASIESKIINDLQRDGSYYRLMSDRNGVKPEDLITDIKVGVARNWLSDLLIKTGDTTRKMGLVDDIDPDIKEDDIEDIEQ